jgi:hypothetical protein
MLTKVNKILIGALVVQVALALFLFMRSDESAPLAEQPLLAGFDAGAVTSLKVYADGKPTPLEIVKRGNDWVLASQFDYPVDPAKVEAALSPIAKLAAAEPVATSATRHKQLRVGDADFDRKLVITAGGTDTTIYVGGPAGLRRNAVRIGSDERVFGAAGISSNAFGAEARDWVKGSYYQQTSRDIEKLVIQKGTSTIELGRVPTGTGSGSASPLAPEDFTIAIDGAPITLAAGETIDKFAVTTIFSDVATITATPADPKRDVSKPTATITVHRPGGTDVLDVIADDVTAWIKQRGIERATTIDKERIKSALEAERGKLVTKEPPTGTGSAAPPPDLPGAPF